MPLWAPDQPAQELPLYGTGDQDPLKNRGHFIPDV